jgi:preprotein translocase subunit Sss1
MELFLLLIQIPLLIFIIRYIRKLHSDSLLISSYYYLLSFKVTAGLCLGVLYFNYYKEGDTISYYNVLELFSKIGYLDVKNYLKLVFFSEIPVGFENQLQIINQPRVSLFIRVISPFYILSGSNYWLLSIYLSLFSFSGLWILSNTLLRLYKIKSWAIMIAFFICPSVVFWSAGFLKESLIIGIMGFLVSTLLNLIDRRMHFSSMKFILLLLFSYILLYIKFYYFAALFAILIPYGIVKYFSGIKGSILQSKKSLRILCLFLIIIFVGFIISLAHEKLRIDTLAESIFLNYDSTLKASHGKNVFIFEGLNSNPASFPAHIPTALSYGLFGPFLWQCQNLLALFCGIENTVILIFFITFLLTNMKKEKMNKIDIEEISLIMYVSILAITMAFASPNWGSLVRYKVGYLPFFLLLILNNNPVIYLIEKRWNFLNRAEKKS